MDDGAEVLGYGRWPGGGGRPWDELLDDVLDDRRYRPLGGDPWLTKLVLVGDRVVDVVRRLEDAGEIEINAAGEEEQLVQ